MGEKSTREQALELAYAQARKRIAALEPRQVEKCTSAVWHETDGTRYWTVEFLGRPYSISMPDGEVREGNEMKAPLVRSVLILHYLIETRETGGRGTWIDFRQLPGGVAYYEVFRGRIISRLTRMFQKEPPSLVDAARRLGGEPVDFGDVAVRFRVFPKVFIVFALWSGDEEFGSEGTVLFDADVSAHLSTEDAIIACEEILGALSAHVKRL